MRTGFGEEVDLHPLSGRIVKSGSADAIYSRCLGHHGQKTKAKLPSTFIVDLYTVGRK